MRKPGRPPGRPPVAPEVKRRHAVATKLTDMEAAFLEAARGATPKAEFVRTALMAKAHEEIWRTENLDAIRENRGEKTARCRTIRGRNGGSCIRMPGHEGEHLCKGGRRWDDAKVPTSP